MIADDYGDASERDGDYLATIAFLGWIDAVAKEAWIKNAVDDVDVSGTHLLVAECVRTVLPTMEVVLECLTADECFSLDVYVPALDLGVEVDGPTHYAEASASSSARRRRDQRRVCATRFCGGGRRRWSSCLGSSSRRRENAASRGKTRPPSRETAGRGGRGVEKQEARYELSSLFALQKVLRKDLFVQRVLAPLAHEVVPRREEVRVVQVQALDLLGDAQSPHAALFQDRVVPLAPRVRLVRRRQQAPPVRRVPSVLRGESFRVRSRARRVGSASGIRNRALCF